MAGRGPLDGIEVVEIAGGVAGAWCGRLLAELGATVRRAGRDPALAAREEVPGDARTRGLLDAWLNDGKSALEGDPAEAVARADLLVIGEEAEAPGATPRVASVDLSWFGGDGPAAGWRGSDLIALALAGIVHPAGPVDGPPRFPGDLQASLIGGATGVVAALAALLGQARIGGGARRMEVSILEACMILGELQVADIQWLDRPLHRVGLNRFTPTCPLSIHRCREGWLGVTLITPAQWQSFCRMLGRPDLAEDPGLQTVYQREHRADEIEAFIDANLPARTAEDWAALGRAEKVPLVVVPDAAGLIGHEVFRARGAVRAFDADGREVVAPASPQRVGAPAGPGALPGVDAPDHPTALLAGLRVADFSMGWAGPLATRIMADLGAEVVKVEAGRYPDWWRAVQWSPEAIARHQYETSCRFCAVNRGKKSVSFDLSTEEGRDLAKGLVAVSDAVIENHAAGVMDKLTLGWADLSRGRDDLVMVSMSAFGAGNALSETRAYGSTLEQASGMPSFRGLPDEPPAMGHIAYGDPIGGIYGVGAMLAALYHRQRTGAGQWLNLSHVEALLPATAPAMLARSVTGAEPARRGNGHAAMAPHGIWRAKGADAWLAVSVRDDGEWRALAELLGRADLAELDLAGRMARGAEIDTALAAWAASRASGDAAEALQAADVCAAPVLDAPESMVWPHLAARDFYLYTERVHVGAQRQVGLALRIDGQRAPLRGVAPFLGGDTAEVMAGAMACPPELFDRLSAAGIIALRPTSLRGAA